MSISSCDITVMNTEGLMRDTISNVTMEILQLKPSIYLYLNLSIGNYPPYVLLVGRGLLRDRQASAITRNTLDRRLPAGGA